MCLLSSPSLVTQWLHATGECRPPRLGFRLYSVGMVTSLHSFVEGQPLRRKHSTGS